MSRDKHCFFRSPPRLSHNVDERRTHATQSTDVARDDHAAQLVYYENVQLGGGLAELLLQDLQDGLHDLRSVPQSHRDVSQGPDGVFRDQVSIPGT